MEDCLEKVPCRGGLLMEDSLERAPFWGISGGLAVQLLLSWVMIRLVSWARVVIRQELEGHNRIGFDLVYPGTVSRVT